MQDAKSKIYFFGFFFLFLVFAASSFYSYALFSASRDELNQTTSANDQQLDSILHMRVAVRERAIILWHMTLQGDLFERDELFQKFYHYGSEYVKARKKFLSLPNSPEEKALLKNLDSETNTRAPVLRDFADKLMSDDLMDYTEQLNQTLTDQIVVAQVLDQLISLQQRQNNNARAQSEKQIEDILSNQIQIMILIFVFGFSFAGFVINSTAKQRKELADANKQLEIQANHDSLTGLVNRSFLLKQLGLLLANARRHKRQGAVIFIDLDNFKPINDTYGHKMGDLFLQLLSQKMLDNIRETDILCRMGGDEFILVITHFDQQKDCISIAEKLITTLSTEYHIEGNTVKTSASIGIYILDDDQVTAEEAIIMADKAMYQAKKAGKNRYHLI